MATPTKRFRRTKKKKEELTEYDQLHVLNDSLPTCSYAGEQIVDSTLEKIANSRETMLKKQVSDISETEDNEPLLNVVEEQNLNINPEDPREVPLDVEINLEPTLDFGDQFDDILKACNEEAKVRNSDLLADEDVFTEFDNSTIDAMKHCGQIIEDEILEACPRSDEKDEDCDQSQKPLFGNSPHSLGVTVLLICCFIIRFRLPDEAISYLLRLIACILPHGHRLMGSLYHFRNFIKKFTSDALPNVTFHCNFCYTVVGKQCKQCPSCFQSLIQTGTKAYFLQIKLVSQLTSLWKTSEFCDAVRSHRFQHYKKNLKNKLFDIYDGNLYKMYYENDGILSNKNNLSFSLNTDGAPLFKSSSVSIWPVYMLINELPISQRKRRHNALLYGVWVSNKKPQMWSFFKPLFNEVQYLESKGHTFTDKDGTNFLCKCILLTCTCDLPARALVYNCNQFNGEYSCWYCLQSGETFRHETGGISRIFPYIETNPMGPARNRETVNRDVEEAINKVLNNKSKFTVNGHKGKFWFQYLKHFDVVKSCVIDYMHGVCLGTVKQLLTLWFDKNYKSKEFSFFPLKSKVNEALKCIKPTIFVTRIPRPLDEITHWKSSEYRNFLLYWGIPVLDGILTEAYFVHFCLLARSIFILSKEGITQEELQIAEQALLLFVEEFSELYGNQWLTLNQHQLVHLVDCVRNTGPLFVNNCFIFEDLNGFIIKHIHGTQGVDTQLTNIINMLKVPPIMFGIFLKDSQETELLSIYNELTDSVTGRHKYENDIEDGIRPVGKVITRILTQEEQNLVLKFGVTESEVKFFDRVNMYKKGFYVYCKEYERLKKRQQYVVTCSLGKNSHFCMVLAFYQCTGRNQQPVNLVLVKYFEKVKSIGCVWQVKCPAKLDLIPINCILNINNIVEINEKTYICTPPNRYDRD